MAELLLELFSEEIPARMQEGGADSLSRLVAAALAPLAPADLRTFFGPRRIALAGRVGAAVAEFPQRRARAASECTGAGAGRIPAQAPRRARRAAPGG